MDTKETVWASSAEQVKKSISPLKQTNPNLALFYDWHSSNNIAIENYLEKLMLTSYLCNTDSEFREKLPQYIHYVEHFLVKGIQLGFFTGENLDRIVSLLNTKFREIKLLPPELRGCFAQSYDDIIEINPEMQKHPNSPNLNEEEITMLYMFHELGHKVLNVEDFEVTKKYCASFKKIMEEKGQKYENTIPLGYVYYGFVMLEETLAQELAETLTYATLGKTRPNSRLEMEFDTTFKSNFDYYGIFEKPTIDMGRTMRGCGKSNSDSKKVLQDMIKRSLHTDSFSEDLIAEYNAKDARGYLDLFCMLQHMGNILNEKYASFGIRRMPKSTTAVNKSLRFIEMYADRNENYFEYQQGEFKRVDFEKYISGPSQPGKK